MTELPSVGVDIERVERFQDARRSLFTPAEWEHAAGRADSLAGIWCAKEAVVKAVSRWREVHVRNVEVTWRGEAPRVELPGFEVEVSISHTSEYAVAMVVARPV